MLLTSLLAAMEAAKVQNNTVLGTDAYSMPCNASRKPSYASCKTSRALVLCKRAQSHDSLGLLGGITSLAASGAALAAAVEACWLAIKRALNSRQSVSAWDAGRLSGTPSLCLSGCLEPSLLSELRLCKFQRHLDEHLYDSNTHRHC